MIEKRKRAQRSRCGGSITVLKNISQRSGTDGTATGSGGYEAAARLARRIFCG
jgi:hypothetical protein